MSLGLDRNKVKLVPHDPAWAGIYDDEEAKIKKILGEDIVEIHHIGSTSIPGIMAKPLMSILIVVKDLETAKRWVLKLAEHGYHIREDDERHLLYAKGPDHSRSHHLHIAPAGSEYAKVTLLFRDHLRTHPAVAKDYEKLKLKLAKEHAGNRPEYGRLKADFIIKIVNQAKAAK